MKLSKAKKRMIEEWLELMDCDKEFACPFDPLAPLGRRSECRIVCPELFKTLQKRRDKEGICEVGCPCAHYTLTHVKRIARRAIL